MPEPVEALLGIEPISQSEGTAVVEVTVTGSLANAHGICHGGVMFLLADAAMGRASNFSVPSLASHAEVDFLEAVPVGSRLRATAQRRQARKKLGIWDVAVATVGPDGTETVVAEFRGRTLQITPR